MAPMQRLRGTPASAGVAVGPVVVVRPARLPAGGTIAPDQADDESVRLAVAMDEAARELDALAGRVAGEGHGDEGAIFAAQAAMARDAGLRGMAEQRIREAGDDAVGAVLAASRAFAEQLARLGDELLAARAADVLDVGQRIARRAAGEPQPRAAELNEPSVVAAEDLPPSVTATLPRERLLALVLEAGSATAHAAILARAYGIPAVVGVTGLLAALERGRGGEGASGGAEASAGPIVALDGASGEVFVDPDEQALERFRGLAEAAARTAEQDRGERHLPAETRDGVRVTLLANVGGPGEAAGALELGAEGVGLFRTEFLFIERPTPPTEEEQLAAYREVVEAFAPLPVTIRLLDVGGDKPLPFLAMAREANPFLGVRALRLAPQRPELFVVQLRAAMRAALAGPVKVMAPMVADATDAALLQELADRAYRELVAAGVEHREVALGVMLEIPSAILVASSYFGRLAFASLGTNDLLQYALAVDRTNPALGRYQDSLHPALLRLVSDAVAEAQRAGIKLSVCGEMAGEPAAALCLVGLGVRQLSMASPSLPAVRRAVRASDAATLADAARWALTASTAAEVRERFGALLPPGERV
jgi:phosphoenolpyruvate-protein phosphotransferase